MFLVLQLRGCWRWWILIMTANVISERLLVYHGVCSCPVKIPQEIYHRTIKSITEASLRYFLNFPSFSSLCVYGVIHVNNRNTIISFKSCKNKYTLELYLEKIHSFSRVANWWIPCLTKGKKNETPFMLWNNVTYFWKMLISTESAFNCLPL